MCVFKRLFCCHSYQKIGFREAYDRGTRYSIRKYRCEKCGKEVIVDGRRDQFTGGKEI